MRPFLVPNPIGVRTRCEVHHLDDSPLGVRLIEISASPMVLIAAPWQRLPALIAGLSGLQVAAYVLAGAAFPEGAFMRLYVGESRSLRERLSRHARDPNKSFVSTAFVLTSRDPTFAKQDVEALQVLLDRTAEDAERAMIVRGARPHVPDLDAAAWERAAERIAQARFMFAAAGCALLEPRSLVDGDRDIADPSISSATKPTRADRATSIRLPKLDVGLSHAQRPATPINQPDPEHTSQQVFTLANRDLWAMAVEEETHGSVVIRAGSEMARDEIRSCDPSTQARRKAFAEAGILAEVAGRSDRWRLTRDTPVSSLTGAARILTGSHVGRQAWRPVQDPRPGR